MKLCILLVGQMRTYTSNTIIESYHKYLGDNHIDIYICTWSNKGHSNHHGERNYNHSYTNDVITEDTLNNHYKQFPFFNIKQILVHKWSDWYNSLSESYKTIYHTPFGNHANHNTSVPAEFMYQQAVTMLPTENIYDRVVVLRPDMALTDNLPISIHDNPNIIYFQCICVGCMDHCWFSSQKSIVKQLQDIYDNYIKHSKVTQSTDNNVLLFHQAKINNIQVIRYKKPLVSQII